MIKNLIWVACYTLIMLGHDANKQFCHPSYYTYIFLKHYQNNGVLILSIWALLYCRMSLPLYCPAIYLVLKSSRLSILYQGFKWVGKKIFYDFADKTSVPYNTHLLILDLATKLGMQNFENQQYFWLSAIKH